MTARVREAVEALREGLVILVFDSSGREGETDLVVASQFVSPEVIRTMRTDAGGLICTTVPPAAWEAIGLPLMDDVLSESSQRFTALEGLVPRTLPYDQRSAFSLSVNHVDTYTGITDADRALTITKLADFISRSLTPSNGWAARAFGREFRAPGHVPLLNAAPRLLEERLGHTELVTALLTMADLTPTATICETLSRKGGALQPEEAKSYARRHNTVFLRGAEIVEAWGQWSG